MDTGQDGKRLMHQDMHRALASTDQNGGRALGPVDGAQRQADASVGGASGAADSGANAGASGSTSGGGSRDRSARRRPRPAAPNAES